MRAWIVVESMFGNTRKVADLVAEGLSPRMKVEVFTVGRAPRSIPDAVDLLVVGGPTHAFGMSRRSTREDAVKRGATESAESGLRDWLDQVGGIRPGLLAAAFDTRVQKAPISGSAAKIAARRLRRLGCAPAARPASFYVEGVEGPLRPGESARAHVWGTNLAVTADHQLHASPA